MKHRPLSEVDLQGHDKLIDRALEAVALEIAPAHRRTLNAYLELVMDENTRISLTAVRSYEDAVWLHVVDSLLALPQVAEAPSGALLDLGSGTGFPGVPLAICSSRSTTLVESVRKKADFLQRACAELGLDVTVVCARAEELAGEHRERYAVVVARALAPLPSLVELAQPVLMPGGFLIAYKGQPAEEEVNRGDRVARQLGLRRTSTRLLSLPEPEEAARTLVVYQRVGSSRVRLPRRVGLAQSRPLA